MMGLSRARQVALEATLVVSPTQGTVGDADGDSGAPGMGCPCRVVPSSRVPQEGLGQVIPGCLSPPPAPRDGPSLAWLWLLAGKVTRGGSQCVLL